MDEKYMVFKRSDFFEMMGRLALPPWTGRTASGHVSRLGKEIDCAEVAERIQEDAERTRIADAVVIRRQDMFAPPALDTYANSIQTAMEMLQATAMAANVDGLDELREIADYFSEQAAKAWEERRKIPD